MQMRNKKDFDFFDRELLKNQNKKAFKSAAYGAGIGIGLLILLPILPDVGNEDKANLMKHVFFVLSIVMILYSAAVTSTLLFFRENMKLIMFLLNWVVMPVILTWGAAECYKAVTQ